MRRITVHTSVSLQPSSVRWLLCIAAIQRFQTWMNDVRQGYLQSLERLSREEYLKNPTKEFDLQNNQRLQLLKPLYGLTD